MKRHPSIRPSHPGEVIADGLHESGVSKVDLAQALGVSRNSLYGLINQKHAVTAEMAVRLEAAFGSTAETWLKMQAAHDLWKARATVNVSELHKVMV